MVVVVVSRTPVHGGKDFVLYVAMSQTILWRGHGRVRFTAKANDGARRVERAAVVHDCCVSVFEVVGDAYAINLGEKLWLIQPRESRE